MLFSSEGLKPIVDSLYKQLAQVVLSKNEHKEKREKEKERKTDKSLLFSAKG